MSSDPIFSVSDFVAVFNQTISYAYPKVTIIGEISNFRVSKNRWVYFDLKDETASVKFFSTVYQLPGPLEDGMVLKVVGAPALHPQFGFSITVSSLQLAGEGTIARAAKLLEAKLEKEGLFKLERKRPLPYPPAKIGLITSGESAAYADFVKILKARWGGIKVELYDVLVQGVDSPAHIVEAIEYFNKSAETPEVLVITRGGGSADDLQSFNTESVTRAVAGSRIPTLVAIGHEVDISIAERAADMRASTPSNAAELLTPDKKHEISALNQLLIVLDKSTSKIIDDQRLETDDRKKNLSELAAGVLDSASRSLKEQKKLIGFLNPESALKRGYALIKKGSQFVGADDKLNRGDEVDVLLLKQELRAKILLTKDRSLSTKRLS